MATAKQDYMRFLTWLHALNPAAPSHVRRFANMVHGNFEAIADTSPQRNARASYLATLSRRALLTASDGPPEEQNDEHTTEWPLRRLHQLKIGPFRGFVREEDFDLRRRVVLFYGPNGSGKSSICEAVERAMLGTVEEAGLKRIDDGEYFCNIYAGRFVEPTLMAAGADGREFRVRANADLYRFCFIEKNRIDAFSRIAQRPHGQRADLIATLFGMEKFSDFCSRFNEQIAPVLVLDARNQRELQLKREALSRDIETVDSEAERLADHDAADEAFAADFAPGTTFARLCAIVGSTEAPGRLAELNGLLNSLPGRVIGVDRTTITASFERTKTAADALSATDHELHLRASQVSFRALYGAVLELEVESGSLCPACETPMNQVRANPFQKARDGLVQLHELAELQERQERERAELAAASSDLWANLEKLFHFIESRNETYTAAGTHLAAILTQPSYDGWWNGVYMPQTAPDQSVMTLEPMLALADQIYNVDQVTRGQLESRASLAVERDDLLECQRYIERRDEVRRRIVSDASASRERIAAFEEANARLIADAATEQANILRDTPIVIAYNEFLTYLRLFRNELPGMLIADLGESARDLYNEFNRSDFDADKIAGLYLPLTGEQRIEIAFRGQPERRVDALQVLSEGHIRCLGLAILLAKAIRAGSPILVFDDVVNAIDHEHRHGIRETIFASEHLIESQILVTCHSPEFIKDIKNALPRERRTDCHEYVLMHHEGDHHPRVHREVPSSAYIDRARHALQRFQIRDSLGNSRRALEMLSNKAWKWLASYDLGDLRVRKNGPTAPLQLRDVCDALRVKLSSLHAFDHPSKAPLRVALDEILNASNLTWTYLNGGTHEEADRDDFDQVEVELVVSRLERIDELDLRQRR